MGGGGRPTGEKKVKDSFSYKVEGKKWIFQWMKENTTPIINKSTFKKISLSKKGNLRSKMKTQV